MGHRRRPGLGIALALLASLLGAAPPLKLAVPADRPYLAGARTVPSLPAILHVPDGIGPFPAVVMLSGCGGFSGPGHGAHGAAWAATLAGWGYVALQLDSFTPRRHPEGVCGLPGAVAMADRASDAFAGKAYLSLLPYVDPDRVFVIGWSHGGLAALAALDRLPRAGDVAPFRAAVALYPYCVTPRQPDTPVLVLIGARDDWCPASRAEALKAAWELRPGWPEFALAVYPEARHGFDDAGLTAGATFQGHRLQYEPRADADARVRIRAFLDRYRDLRP